MEYAGKVYSRIIAKNYTDSDIEGMLKFEESGKQLFIVTKDDVEMDKFYRKHLKINGSWILLKKISGDGGVKVSS